MEVIPKRKNKTDGKPGYISVREAAAVGDSRFRFFEANGRLPRTSEDCSEYYVCPFEQGEHYRDELTGNLIVWLGDKWSDEAASDLQAPVHENDHFNVNDDDLNMLLNLAGDMLTGQGNMDTALFFAHYLEKVEERLKTNG